MIPDKLVRFFLIWLLVILQFSFTVSKKDCITKKVITIKPIEISENYLYDSLKLSELGLTRPAFEYAIKGYHYFLASGQIANDMVISIIDFSLPSNAKRLFVLDLKNKMLLFNTYVAHGKKSGKQMAVQFSNKPSSYKSSLGFYITSGTYRGKHGYSLKLLGEEEGINDKAEQRAIVMHAAAYVNEKMIHSQGYIGRSEGCPALPVQEHRAIIERIKNGSTLFMYSPDAYYLSHSPILKSFEDS